MGTIPFFCGNGINVQNVLQANDSQFSFGANILFTLGKWTIGNSTINASSNSTIFAIGNASLNATAIILGANVVLDTVGLMSGNSTINLVANSILVKVANSSGIANLTPTLLQIGTSNLSTTSLVLGANVLLNQSTLIIGNSTVNAAILQNQVRVSNSSGVANLEPTLLTIGGSTMNSTSVNTSFLKSDTSNTIGNAQIFSLGVGTAASGAQGRVTAIDNVISFFSDKRLKEGLQVIDNALGKLQQINGYEFFFNELANQFGFTDDSAQVGVIAQEIMPILPHAIWLAPFDLDENGGSKSGEYYLTVQMEKLIPLLIEAIKELDKKIESLRS